MILISEYEKYNDDVHAITIKDIRIDDPAPSELIDCNPVFINYD